MIDVLILLAPLIVLAIVVLFGFVGCGGEPFTSRDTPSEDPETPPTEPSEPYAKAIEATTGFLALWPLNETSGIVAVATSPILNIDGEVQAGSYARQRGRVLSQRAERELRAGAERHDGIHRGAVSRTVESVDGPGPVQPRAMGETGRRDSGW